MCKLISKEQPLERGGEASYAGVKQSSQKSFLGDNIDWYPVHVISDYFASSVWKISGPLTMDDPPILGRAC